ncbi:MAG TPA: phosphodiester glycosidase family protein [Actinomycetes bacterium]|nr:phosphodiester glycosidase family protein [Actinomycetes bacterium]
MATDEQPRTRLPLEAGPRNGRFRPTLTRRGRAVLRALALVMALLVLVTAWSLGRALTAPGTDSASARLAEWARNHRLGPLVTAAETVQYRLHQPKVGGRPDVRVLDGQRVTPPPLTSRHASGAGPSATAVPVHAPLAPMVSHALRGEGVFRTVATVHGQPAEQVAYLRPDSSHTSYLAGVAWLSGSLIRLVQHPGYLDPGNHSYWTQPDRLPASQRTGLIATFNSGFRLQDSRGGYYADGHTVGTLTRGAASLVVYSDGHADIGSWGSDVHRGADVVSVRQNLQLLIDGGSIAPHLSQHVLTHWGGTVGAAYYVWRSGVGVTASGDLVYVAGDALSVRSLASLLKDAGAVRAMELDINPEWVSYMWYSPGSSSGGPVPHKLAAFVRPAHRYYSASSRDFFAVYGR